MTPGAIITQVILSLVNAALQVILSLANAAYRKAVIERHGEGWLPKE